MKPKSSAVTTPAVLRQRAEGQLRKQQSERTGQQPAADIQRTLHELQVHQIELEMQNAELQDARNRMEILLEKYTDLYDFAPVGYFSLDAVGQILEANLAGAAMFGVERAKLVHRCLTRFVAPASQPSFLAFLKQIFTENGNQVCEVGFVKEDATTFWGRMHATAAISVSGPRTWCRVTVADITSRKQAEDLLLRNEALFTALIQQAPVGVYVVDDRLRLAQVNPKARPSFSKVEPLIGRDLSDVLRILWPAQVADEVVKRFRHTLKTGEPYVSPEFTEQRHDTGASESYEWQLQRITLPAGQQGVVCFFSDITRRKHMETVQRRAEVLAATNQRLELQIVRRRTVEAALKKSELHQRELLVQSRHMEQQLRKLSHQILQAQEEERKRISRELHDQVVQTLSGINVQLAGLKTKAAIKSKDLQRTITSTQRLVEQSVEIVHRFARELRPAVLDDLGLIPALRMYLKDFMEQTGIRVNLITATANRLEHVESATRTVLYRVAQAALSNIAKHAHASQVTVNLQKLPSAIQLAIKDDGQGFEVEKVLFAKRYKRLGLLGMRERVEMVGGSFVLDSAPGKGTTIHAKIPLQRKKDVTQ